MGRQPKAKLPERPRVGAPAAVPTRGGRKLAPTPKEPTEPAHVRAAKEHVRKTVVEPMIDAAVKEAQAMERARARQEEFESRPLLKPLCTASLFGTAAVSGDAHCSVGFMEQDGLGLVTSRAELQQLSM